MTRLRTLLAVLLAVALLAVLVQMTVWAFRIGAAQR